jgi:NTP pyrophosphatase (non-canonical NTP hydrolase)
MNNEIEDSVDIRAKLEQLTEECGELIQASMKLIRALGNGNPTKVSKDEAIAKVLEEWSDVEIAGIYILRMLEDMADYDIYEKIEEIGKFKEQRWIDRVRKGEVMDEDENDNGEGISGGCCSDGDYCNF